MLLLLLLMLLLLLLIIVVVVLPSEFYDFCQIHSLENWLESWNWSATGLFDGILWFDQATVAIANYKSEMIFYYDFHEHRTELICARACLINVSRIKEHIIQDCVILEAINENNYSKTPHIRCVLYEKKVFEKMWKISWNDRDIKFDILK